MIRAAREVAEHGLRAFSFDAFTTTLASEGISVREHFADEGALLRAAAIRAYRNVGNEALTSVANATNGVDALAAFVRAYVVYWTEHMDEYELALAQVEHRRYGIDESVIV